MDTQHPQETAGEKILCTIEKSDLDQIKVRETKFKGKEYIDIRIFSKKEDGSYFPTKKGIHFAKDQMRDFQEAITNIAM